MVITRIYVVEVLQLQPLSIQLEPGQPTTTIKHFMPIDLNPCQIIRQKPFLTRNAIIIATLGPILQFQRS